VTNELRSTTEYDDLHSPHRQPGRANDRNSDDKYSLSASADRQAQLDRRRRIVAQNILAYQNCNEYGHLRENLRAIDRPLREIEGAIRRLPEVETDIARAGARVKSSLQSLWSEKRQQQSRNFSGPYLLDRATRIFVQMLEAGTFFPGSSVGLPVSNLPPSPLPSIVPQVLLVASPTRLKAAPPKGAAITTFEKQTKIRI